MRPATVVYLPAGVYVITGAPWHIGRSRLIGVTPDGSTERGHGARG